MIAHGSIWTHGQFKAIRSGTVNKVEKPTQTNTSERCDDEAAADLRVTTQKLH